MSSAVEGAVGGQVEDRPEADPDVEEVRLALALNGGVSLAVWMGGCAVELDRARRTHRTPVGEKPLPGVYQAVCDAFRRELVVDVMSGTSAGGINGALLAAALAHGVALEPAFLRERWLDLGDFSTLLQPLSQRDPTALMQGSYFRNKLEETFKDLLESDQVEAPLEPLPALDVTTTDIGGRTLSFIDTWGSELHAREYRRRFKFRREGDFTPDKLAAAARASASFPIAFEPYAVPRGAAELAGFDRPGRYVVDGGLLDNAPIRAALELIPSRPATRQVRRLLCYINGEPADPGDAEADLAEPLPPDDIVVDAREGQDPTPRTVLGVVLNLPRKAPFADQLQALQQVSRNSGIADQAEQDLLSLDAKALHDVATALLKTYRRRRRLKALQEALSEPALVQRAYKRLDELRAELPWLEGRLEDVDPDAWPWGIDAAKRVHQLALDLTRNIVPGADPDVRRTVLEHQTRVDKRIRTLDVLRDEGKGLVTEAIEALLAGKPAADAFEKLQAELRRGRPTIAEGLKGTADTLLQGLPLGDEIARKVHSQLFGAGVRPGDPLTDDMLRRFVERVVAVDVVRRSFGEDDTLHNAQEIQFAQLTPEAPDPIFTARPFTEKRTPKVKEKLCGAILMHFGAFYRRSWRANDFMWGRLDAAARIVEMLVGATRSRHLRDADDHEPWTLLAHRLANAGPQQCELLEEALADPALDARTDGDLESRLRRVFERDLTSETDDRGEITRSFCRRAVQFEILCEELQHVVAEADKDLELGCTPATLGLDGLDLGEPADVLEAVRRRRTATRTLPVALGRDTPELASDLAARTIAHAGLVGISLSRSAVGMVLSPLTSLRSALLPISGAVSLSRWNRFGVVAAYGAAALYLGGRIAGTDSAPAVDAHELGFFELVLGMVALLVVLGTVALPVARAILEKTALARRLLWALVAFLLLAAALGPGVVAWLAGPLDWAHLLVAPGVEVPWYVAFLPIALGTGAVWVGPRPLRKPLKWLTSVTWAPWSLLLVLAAAVVIAVWFMLGPFEEAFAGKELWQRIAAISPIIAWPLAWMAVDPLPRRLLRRPVQPPAE